MLRISQFESDAKKKMPGEEYSIALNEGYEDNVVVFGEFGVVFERG